MIRATPSLLQARARLALARVQSPPGATVKTAMNHDGTAIVRLILGDTEVLIEQVPRYVESDDLDHALTKGVVTLRMTSCRHAAQKAWSERPWWVAVLAYLHLDTLRDFWIRRRVHTLLEDLWKIPPPAREIPPDHPTVQ